MRYFDFICHRIIWFFPELRIFMDGVQLSRNGEHFLNCFHIGDSNRNMAFYYDPKLFKNGMTPEEDEKIVSDLLERNPQFRHYFHRVDSLPPKNSIPYGTSPSDYWEARRQNPVVRI